MEESGNNISFWGAHGRKESHSLEVHWKGLCHLNNKVKMLEEKRLRESASNPHGSVDFAESFDAECESGDPLLLSYFFWYSCSVVSFVNLFNKAFDVSNSPATFKNVKKFRNKVSAHFSHVDPNGDNQAIQDASLIQTVSWDNGSYSVGRGVFHNLDTDKSSPDDWGWELTKTHQHLGAFVRSNLPSKTT